LNRSPSAFNVALLNRHQLLARRFGDGRESVCVFLLYVLEKVSNGSRITEVFVPVLAHILHRGLDQCPRCLGNTIFGLFEHRRTTSLVLRAV
jgi:hypothetical protein